VKQGSKTANMEPRKAVIAFDLYGTLLSTESIALQLAGLFGEDKSGTLAALCRSCAPYSVFPVETHEAY
jgi:hypothetical protein